jgi:hypothetical protein
VVGGRSKVLGFSCCLPAKNLNFGVLGDLGTHVISVKWRTFLAAWQAPKASGRLTFLTIYLQEEGFWGFGVIV